MRCLTPDPWPDQSVTLLHVTGVLSVFVWRSVWEVSSSASGTLESFCSCRFFVWRQWPIDAVSLADSFLYCESIKSPKQSQNCFFSLWIIYIFMCICTYSKSSYSKTKQFIIIPGRRHEFLVLIWRAICPSQLNRFIKTNTTCKNIFTECFTWCFIHPRHMYYVKEN